MLKTHKEGLVVFDTCMEGFTVLEAHWEGWAVLGTCMGVHSTRNQWGCMGSA